MGRSTSHRILNVETLAAQDLYRLTTVAEREHLSARHTRRLLQKSEEESNKNKGIHTRLAQLRLQRMLALRATGLSYKEIGVIVGLCPSYVSILLKKAARVSHQPASESVQPADTRIGL